MADMAELLYLGLDEWRPQYCTYSLKYLAVTLKRSILISITTTKQKVHIHITRILSWP